MADTDNIVARVEQDNARNTVVRVSLVSDGSGLTNYVLVDPTPAAAGAVNLSVSWAGQVFYPGVHLKILRAYYDIQDMKVRLSWKATANEDVLVFGNAPEGFDYSFFGGLRVPAALAGATGQLLLNTVGAVAGATFSFLLHFRKNWIDSSAVQPAPPSGGAGLDFSQAPNSQYLPFFL